MCVSCGAPHAVAPDLIGWTDLEMGHCIWKKQPETPEELEQAFSVFDASCVGCHRYAGTDPAIHERIGPEYCDNAPPRPRTRLADAPPIPIPSFASSPIPWKRFL